MVRTKVGEKAKIRNRYNQVPHLTQDTIWESDKTQDVTQESQFICAYLLIKIHILSLHCIMKTLAVLMSVESEGLLRNIKLAHVFYHPVQA